MIPEFKAIDLALKYGFGTLKIERLPDSDIYVVDFQEPNPPYGMKPMAKMVCAELVGALYAADLNLNLRMQHLYKNSPEHEALIAQLMEEKPIASVEDMQQDIGIQRILDQGITLVASSLPNQITHNDDIILSAQKRISEHGYSAQPIPKPTFNEALVEMGLQYR